MSHVHPEVARARAAVQEAELAEEPSDRFLAAHLAALRVAALLLAIRSHPAATAARGRPQNAWRLIATVAPEFAEWSGFFAATEGKRDAVRAGATTIVTSREADDLVRDAQAFLAAVERSLERRRRAAR